MMATDVLVVGGGIVGRCLALELAAARAGRVLVADRVDRRSGTRRSAAVVRSVAGDPALCELAGLGAQRFQAWRELTGRGCGFRPGVVLVVGPEEAAAVAATGRAAPLSKGDLRRRAPGYRVPGAGVAMLDHCGGVVAPALALAGLGAALRRAGVSLERTSVRRLLVAGGRVAGAVTDRGSLRCETVVVAAGPWSGEVLAGTGASLPITVRRTPVVVLDARHAGDPVVDLVAGVLLRPYGRRAVLAGTRRSGDVLASVRAVAPHLAAARVLATWTGYYDMTPDERPLVGPIPGLDGAFVAAGFSGGGFKLAPAVGRLAARLVAGGPAPPELAPFSPARFASALDPVPVA